MTIGFITPEYPHPKIKHAAGIGSSIKNLVNELVRKDIKVVIFVYHQLQDEVFQDHGVEVHSISAKKYQFLGWYLYRKHLEKYINKVVIKQEIDLLEAPDWTGITAFMNFNAPLVIRFHGSDAYFCKLEKRKQKFKNYFFEKNAIKRAKAYIAPTEYAKIETAKIFNLKKEKIKTIHYGLKLDNFNNDAPLEYNRKTILYIGTIIRKKGVFELAAIFNNVINKILDAKLIMIGNDAADIKTGMSSTFDLVWKTFSDEAKEQCNYLGKIPYTEVQEHIRNAHVCVFPSFAETLGMVTIESMAMQKPVVNTSIGWGQELMEHEKSGFLIHPENIEGYSLQIIQLFNDEAYCYAIGKEARKKVIQSFDIEKNADINIDYYKQITS